MDMGTHSQMVMATWCRFSCLRSGLFYSTLVMARIIRRFGAWRTMIASGAAQMIGLISLPWLQSAPFACIVVMHAFITTANTTCFTTTISAVRCPTRPRARAQDGTTHNM